MLRVQCIWNKYELVFFGLRCHHSRVTCPTASSLSSTILNIFSFFCYLRACFVESNGQHKLVLSTSYSFLSKSFSTVLTCSMSSELVNWATVDSTKTAEHGRSWSFMCLRAMSMTFSCVSYVQCIVLASITLSSHAMKRTCNSSFHLLGMASQRSVFHLSYFLMLRITTVFHRLISSIQL